jgi:hypothetical protein
VTTTRSMAIAALFSLTLAAPALAGEDITEHDTYEKRTMKIETMPAMPTTTIPAPSRVYEHHDESESTTIERHSATPPAPVVKERTTQETTDTKVEK